MKYFFITELSNISAITSAAGVVTGITKLTAKQFWKYNLPKETGNAEETYQTNDENGTAFWQQSVKFPINKLSASVRNELTLVAQNRVALVWVDENGKGWLYGKDNGLFLNTGSKAQSGVKYGDRNGYDLEFVGAEEEMAYEVDSSTLGTLETPGT